MDDDLQALRAAVAKRRIRGIHVAEGHGIESRVPQLYRIPGSYFTYLIARDGRISAKDLHLEALAAAIRNAVDAVPQP